MPRTPSLAPILNEGGGYSIEDLSHSLYRVHISRQSTATQPTTSATSLTKDLRDNPGPYSKTVRPHAGISAHHGHENPRPPHSTSAKSIGDATTDETLSYSLQVAHNGHENPRPPHSTSAKLIGDATIDETLPYSLQVAHNGHENPRPPHSTSAKSIGDATIDETLPYSLQATCLNMDTTIHNRPITHGYPSLPSAVRPPTEHVLAFDEEYPEAFTRAKGARPSATAGSDDDDDAFIVDTGATSSCTKSMHLMHHRSFHRFRADEQVRILGINGDQGLLSPGEGNLHDAFHATRALYVPEASANILSWWSIRKPTSSR